MHFNSFSYKSVSKPDSIYSIFSSLTKFSVFDSRNSRSCFTMGKNFKIIPQGPLIPENVNQKSFVSVKVIPGQESVFRNGMVAKMTSGALRIRDADEKKGGEVANNKDIIEFYGDARGLNEHRDDHAACRVFTSNNYKPTPSKTK